MVPERQLNGTWVYPPIEAALATSGLEEIRVYIARRQNTVVQNIMTHPIMVLCLAVEWMRGIRLLQIWWEHPGIYIPGIRLAHAAADMGEKNWTEESEENRD